MDQLAGLTFPSNGTKVFQEDWNFEQDTKSSELIERTKDSFSPGIVSGGVVTNGVGSSINIQPCIAYDSSGKRVQSPLVSNLAVVTGQVSIVVLRHKFEEEIVTQPDSTTLTYRHNSYEFIFRTIVQTDDIPLFRITNASGVTTVNEDLRTFRTVTDGSLVNKTNIAERFRGIINGRIICRENTRIAIPQFNVYEVNGKHLQIRTPLILDFSTLSNIFRSDGNPIASILEIQNKHLYVMLSENESLSAQIISNSELLIGSHSYNDNAALIKDYYSSTPSAWVIDKNGFYKSDRRIIAVIRIGVSSTVEFWYDLGYGHRFADVQNLAVGQRYTETRWKREHPNCYHPDGSAVLNMSSEAPELFRILGSNLLPDWMNRFSRNIDINGSRNIRDTEEDAFQAWQAGVRFGLTDYYGSGVYDNASLGGQIQSHSLYIQFSDLSQADFPITAMNDGIHGTPRTADETRPKNYGVLDQIVKG